MAKGVWYLAKLEIFHEKIFFKIFFQARTWLEPIEQLKCFKARRYRKVKFKERRGSLQTQNPALRRFVLRTFRKG